jgi:hypothetical protein
VVATVGNVPPNWRAWLEAQQNPAQPASPLQDKYAQESNPALAAPVETATAPPAPDPVETVPPNPASAPICGFRTRVDRSRRGFSRGQYSTESG